MPTRTKRTTWPAPVEVPLGRDGLATPLRHNDEIQGNVLAGFNKDHQLLLFLRLPDTERGRAWLQQLEPRLSRNDQVAAFNERFSAARHAGGADPDTLSAVWTNVSFTAEGVDVLAPGALTDLRRRAGLDAGVGVWANGAADPAITDRVGDTGTSAPSGWLFGSTDPVHAVLCVAADHRDDLATAVAAHRAAAARHGVLVVFEQPGATLPGAAAGHEHFGFKDGISQPGVTGFDPPDPDDHTVVAGKPGTDLIAAGTFVLGYRRDPETRTGVPATLNVPCWMFDGSFLVTRRLAQDVAGFWNAVDAANSTLPPAARCPVRGIPSADALAAKLVGRWRSGTPTANAPAADDRSGRDPRRDNAFDFADDTHGDNTPFAAHIRKVYPRAGGTAAVDALDEDHTRPRRILRRGIPFGRPFAPTSGRGSGLDAERGLVFQCYQASLEDQFVFLQQIWVDNPTFPNPDTGDDPVIGRGGAMTVRACGADQRLGFGQFVHTEGSLFSFTPSLTTVHRLAHGQALPVE